MKSSLYPEQELKRRTLFWSMKLRVNPKVVRVQKMVQKWGSCSSSGIVTLADDLVEKSAEFQDFVIVHELLHLRYPKHGRLFTAAIEAYVPRWREMELEK